MFQRRSLKFILLPVFGVLALSVVFGLPQKTVAVAESATSGAVYVGQDEVIDDNFVKFGQTIDIKGTVNGDVVVAAETVTVDGKVAGDVIAAASTVVVRGEVEGNVRVAGGTVLIDAEVGKNTTIFGGQTQISEDAIVGWSLACYSGTLDFKGKVNGHLTASAGQIDIDGTVGGNVDFPGEAGQIIFGPNAQVGKDVTYTGEVKPTVESGATINGEVKQRAPAATDIPKQKDIASLFGITSWLWVFAKLLGLIVLGLLVITILPKDSLKISEKMTSQFSRSLGFGFLALILTPIAGVLLLITVIGIPVAMVAFALWGVGIVLAKVFVSLLVGQKVMDYLRKGKEKAKDQKNQLFLPFLVGAVIFILVVSVPYIGGLIKIVVIAWALGAIVEVKKEFIKEKNA